MIYDLIVIGSGVSGLTAGIYGARYGLTTLILSKNIGGTAMWANKVENYPGFKAISGIELINKIKEQTEYSGVEIKEEEVISIEKSENFKVNDYEAKAVILASGSIPRKLAIKGEDEFLGKGVAYCATCDAPLFKDKITAVIGGGDSALKSATLLSNYCEKVYLVVREDKLGGETRNRENVEKNEKIEIIYNTKIVEIKGEKFVNSVILDTESPLEVDGVFIEIGLSPVNELAKKLGLELDESGYVKVDQAQRTSIEKVYASGDVSNGSNKFMQILTACAEGAIAANSAYVDLQK